MNSDTALELYNEAKGLEGDAGDNPTATSTGGCFCDGQREGISSGFYIDRRHDIFKEVPRMFLIINQGRTSGKCVVIRPNEGKKTYSKKWVLGKLINGAAKLSLCTDVPQAIETWQKEFVLADRPSSEGYQRYCYGRHEERFLFGGSIIPILNKILVSANLDGLNMAKKDMTMPSIVRVEPSDKSQHYHAETNGGNSKEGEYLANTSVMLNFNGNGITETPAVGENVAHEMLGSSILRGIITKCGNQRGSYVTQFTDGCNIVMNATEVIKAKELFKEEFRKLVVKAKVPRADASSIGMISTVNSAAQSAPHIPILGEGEHHDTDEYERLFEEEYDGEVPKILVGLEFPKRFLHWYSESVSENIQIPFWKFVLRKLAEKLHEEGAMTSRELLNLKKAEQHKGKKHTVVVCG